MKLDLFTMRKIS